MNSLDKFYSSFQGLDTRSNKLLQPPGSYRRGTKNNRYNFLDENQQANGFQHKDNSAPNFVDIFEYKYRNVNTGAAEAEVLGVATNGHLYRRKSSTLSFTTHGVATSVSFYYDEVADTFKCDLAGLGSVNISDTMTLAQLKTALELLAGVTVSISGKTDKLAYLLDCVINDSTFASNSVYYWEQVPNSDISCVSVGSVTEANLDLSDATQWTINSVPFPVTRDYNTSDDYEGISSVNLNNSIYITDGGFPMKYDGKTVYRAGLPKQIQTVNFSTVTPTGMTYTVETTPTGMTYTVETTPTGLTSLPSASYLYKARYGFTDYNGSTIFGPIVDLPTGLSISAIAAGNAVKVESKGIYYGPDFPIFSAKVNGTQASGSAGAGITLTVYTGHNILPGMVIRQKTTIQATASGVTRAFDNTPITFYAKVTAVTDTTITLAETIASDLGTNTYSSNFRNNEIINGYFVDSSFENKRPVNAGVTGPGTFTDISIYPCGAFIEVYRTKGNATDGPYYKLGYMDIAHKQTETSLLWDDTSDSVLSKQYVDQPQGDELPRACKYLAAWQGQLVQAGRTPNPTLKNDKYPSLSDPNTAIYASQEAFDDTSIYTESFLCDLQSVYWDDVLTPEGFPQDGTHEYSIDTRYADRVTAIAPNKDSLFALKERSTAVLSGSVGTNDVVMEVLEVDAGCISHRSVEDVRGSLIWLDGINGFFACVVGRLPENIGFPIQDFTKINTLGLNFKTANAANFRKESLYICSVGTSTFVYDYADDGSLKRNCWYYWDRINGKSVLATSDNKLFVWDGTRTWKMKTTNTKYDFTDHKSAIPFVLNTAWASQGHPTIDKHYLNLWINSIQGDFTLTVKQYGNYLEDVVASQSNVTFLPETSAKKAIKEPVKAFFPKLSSISFGMENSQKNKWVRIQGYEIQYSPDYNTGEPKR